MAEMSVLRQAHEAIIRGDVGVAQAILESARGADPFEWFSVSAGLQMKTRNFEAALSYLVQAVPLRPADYTVWFNQGLCWYELGQYERAAECYRQCLKRNFGFGKAGLKLGAAHLVLQDFADALACYERAVGIDPNDAELKIGYATGISILGDDAGAIAQYRAALALNPGSVEAEVALGFSLLRAGQWDEGWSRFEERYRLRPAGAPWDWKPTPPWRGKPSDFEGKRVLLYCEQGHGDTLHFVRYVPLVQKRAERVWFVVHPSMERLMRASFGDAVIVTGTALPEVDITTSIMSLPAVFGTTVDRVPAPMVFKGVRKNEVGARVGLCWHGGARPDEPIANADDKRRSVPFEMFAPMIEMVPCISLQQEDLAQFDVTDWMGTAEIIKGLDLVITVDTAVCHLAGSLGVPVWMLGRAGGCWRWLNFGDRTAWYPSMRVYRQAVLTEWGPVLEQVVSDLRGWLVK